MRRLIFILAGLLAALPVGATQLSLTGAGPSAGGAPAAWTCTDLGSALVACYDVTNASTVHESGGAVSQLDDLSGNGYHVTQSSAGNKPTYSATGFPGSEPGITCDGTDDWLGTSSTAVAMGVSAFAFFLSATGAASGDTDGRFSFQGNGDSSDYGATTSAVLIDYLPSPFIKWASYRAGGKSAVPPFTYAVDTAYRLGTVFDGADNIFYINNSAQTPVASTGTLAATGGLGLCSSYDGALSNYGGTFQRVILMNRAPTSQERTDIDTWLNYSP